MKTLFRNAEYCRPDAAGARRAITVTRNPKSEIRNPKPELGFSLIELLTVIAIIAILAAMIFPVMGSVRQKANESHAISSLHNVSQALGIYKLDERAYPPALGEYWVNAGSQLVRESPLFPAFLKNRDSLHVTGSVDPGYGLPTISPVTGVYNVPAGALLPNLTSAAADPTTANAVFAADDAMDGGWEGGAGNWNYILHYSRYRTLDATDPDYKRQLGFRNPPDDSVVTWVTDFRSYVNGMPTSTSNDIVLFLNGTAEKRPAREVQGGPAYWPASSGGRPWSPWRLLPRSELGANGLPE